MADTLEFARVQLPIGIQADDLVSLKDKTSQRVAALLQPAPKEGPKKGSRTAKKTAESVEAGGIALPAGLAPMTALPDRIGKTFERFGETVTTLAGVRKQRADAGNDPITLDNVDRRSQANEACDQTWRAFHPWLEGWSLAPEDGLQPGKADAQWLFQSIFPAPLGLRFVSLRPSRQWAVMKPKLETLASERGQTIVLGLGGKRLYDQIVAAHAEFGRVFGFLAVTETPEETGGVIAEFNDAKEALRGFIRQVDAWAEPTIPGSEALASFLLGPYVELVAELAQARPSRKAPGTPGTTPPPSAATGKSA